MGNTSHGETGDNARDEQAILQDKLVDEFRSKLDDTLVIAIIGDFDLSNHEHFTQARSILEGLAQNVTTEEASGFNAVPIAEDDVKLIGPVNDLASHDYLAEAGSSNATTNSPSLPVDFADLTDLTDFSESLEERFAALELPKDVNIATLDNEGKVAELQTMFPGLVRLDLELTLRKCKGDFMQACEELLNMQFLEENGLRPKGIDGAFRPDGEIGYKACSENAKDKGKNRLDIDYRLTPLKLSEEDQDLTTPTTPTTSTFRSLVRRNSLPRITTVAGTASRAALSAPDSPALKTTDWQVVQTKQKVRREITSDVPGYDPATSVTETISSARRAWQRGGVYRAAAGVLADVAREQRKMVRAADSLEYEAMVDRTSSPNLIDLHGLPVAEGVRIALQRTQSWWINLGENRARRAREEGFTIVTGLGNHSASGVSPLRQEVSAALKREGWRMTTGTGQFTINGKA